MCKITLEQRPISQGLQEYALSKERHLLVLGRVPIETFSAENRAVHIAPALGWKMWTILLLQTGHF